MSTKVTRSAPTRETCIAVRKYCDLKIEQIENEIETQLQENIAIYNALPWYKRMFAFDPRNHYAYYEHSRINAYREVSNLFRELQDLQDDKATFTVSSWLSSWIDSILLKIEETK